MTSLYDTLLPLVQAINAEGGNFSSIHLSKPVLDAIDAGVETDASLKMIRAKVLEAFSACNGKRDHLGFNKIFEAYSEGVIYLIARRRRHVDLQAVPDGSNLGKTSDFVTSAAPQVGFEVKTINVVDPARTIDAAMDQGFWQSYEALEKARAQSVATGRPGIGFAEGTFAPHGEGANPNDAVSQTASKIKQNLKSGQYAKRPTLLIVNLVRLSVFQNWSNLRQRLEIDTNWGEAPSGHLYAIAAQRLDDPFFTQSHKWPDIRDAGPLPQQGVLRDHEYIPAIVFLQTIWNKCQDDDVIETGFRFYGVWNDEWTGDGFTAEQKAEARRVFDQICDGWNDTHDSQGQVIPDVGALHSDFLDTVAAFHKLKGTTPSEEDLFVHILAADRALFLWQAAEAERFGAATQYVPPKRDEFTTGVSEGDERLTLFVTAKRVAEGIPRLRLAWTGQRWEQNNDTSPVKTQEICF